MFTIRFIRYTISSSYTPRFIYSRFHNFITSYVKTSNIQPFIHDENEFRAIRQKVLNIPTIPEYRIASRIERNNATPDHDSVKTDVPKIKSTKCSKWDNQLIIHYTHEQRFQAYKRDLHRLWNETYRSTPIIHTRLIVGNRNNKALARELVHHQHIKQQQKQP